MTKLDVFILLVVVIFTTSAFAGHFGYTVDGVPRGADGYLHQEYEDWREANYGWEVTFEFWKEQIHDNSVVAEIMGAFGFIYDMVSFQIDGVPPVLSLVFIIINLVTLFLLFLVVRGG